MYRRGVTCFSCHDVHGTANNADTIKPARDLCLTCHSPTSPNGPHAASLEEHTHHPRGSAGSDCVACHMPQVEQTIANINVRSHTFAVMPPALTDEYKMPNSCTTNCHADRSPSWARQAMRGWGNVSPWRIQ
jgi:predicted CXXCH cytochrome family protein